MNQRLRNEEGFTLIGVMVSIIILTVFASIMLTATQFFNNNQYDLRKKTTIEQTSRNKILDIYELDDWEQLSDEKIDTSTGPLEIRYNRLPISDYQTETIEVMFILDELNESYQLERSVLTNG